MLAELTEEMSKEVAKTIAERNREICDRIGATREIILQNIFNLTQAREVKTVYDKDAGIWCYSDPLPDNPTSLKADITLMEYRGDAPAKQQEHKVTVGLSPQFSDMTEAEKKAMEAYEETLIRETLRGPEPDDEAI